MPRKIALVGTHPSGAGAPFNDKSWEVWGVSARAHYFTRATRWYELHRIDGTFDKPGEADMWRGKLKEQCASQRLGGEEIVPVPIKMMFPEPGLGDVVPYPTQEIADRFGTFFMTSTFAWMSAELIHECCPMGKFAEPGTTVGVWGIEMEYGTEYRAQRAGFRHFLKLAEHLGIEVMRRPAGGLIYEPVPYPFWQDDPIGCKLRERNKEASAKAKQKEAAVYECRERISYAKGQVEILQDLEQTEQVKELIVKHSNNLNNLMAMLPDAIKEHVYWSAIDDEQKFFLDYISP